MAVKDELKRYSFTWLIFFLGNGMLLLVNNLESSFARTLISCDEPPQGKLADGELWSGSNKCGNRTIVLNKGTALSSNAQSLESAAKLLMMISAAIGAEIYGRKPIFVAGLTCTTLSVFLFLVATVADHWAHFLFQLGQGLQGAYPSVMLGALVLSDLAQKEETSTADIYFIGQALKDIGGISFGFVAFFCQLFDFANYFYVWLIVLCINGATLYMLICHFQETKVLSKVDYTVWQGTKNELAEYRTLFFGKKAEFYMQMMLVSFVLTSFGEALCPFVIPIQMAYHQMSMPSVMKYLFPIGFLSAFCLPFVGFLCKKFGFRRAWLYSLLALFSCSLFNFFIPISKYAFFFMFYLGGGLLSGFKGLVASIEQKNLKDKHSKYVSAHCLVGYGLTIISGPLYASLFDAGATTYLAKARPCFFSFLCAAVNFSLFFVFHSYTGIWQGAYDGLDMLEAEKKAQAKSAEEKKAAEEKKTD